MKWRLMSWFAGVRVSQNRGTILGGPHKKDFHILGSIDRGPPAFGSLGYKDIQDSGGFSSRFRVRG